MSPTSARAFSPELGDPSRGKHLPRANHYSERAAVISKTAHVLVCRVSVLQDIQIVRDKQELGLIFPICHLSEESLSHHNATTAKEGEAPSVQLTQERVVYDIG